MEQQVPEHIYAPDELNVEPMCEYRVWQHFYRDPNPNQFKRNESLRSSRGVDPSRSSPAKFF